MNPQKSSRLGMDYLGSLCEAISFLITFDTFVSWQLYPISFSHCFRDYSNVSVLRIQGFWIVTVLFPHQPLRPSGILSLTYSSMYYFAQNVNFVIYTTGLSRKLNWYFNQQLKFRNFTNYCWKQSCNTMLSTCARPSR